MLNAIVYLGVVVYLSYSILLLSQGIPYGGVNSSIKHSHTRAKDGHPWSQSRSPGEPSGRQAQKAHQKTLRSRGGQDRQKHRTNRPTTPTHPRHNSRGGTSDPVGESWNRPHPAPGGATHQTPTTSLLYPRIYKGRPSKPSPPSPSAKICLNIRG